MPREYSTGMSDPATGPAPSPRYRGSGMRRLLLVVIATGLVAGCGGDDDEREDVRAPDSGPKIEDPGAIHVHSLGINPKDGALFIATHTGLFRAPEGEQTATRVADRYQDTMGFTVVGPDRFLGSGHPDGREKLPPFLGLIRSTDAGQTWKEVSLMGKSDFHVLEAAARRVYGFGSDYRTRKSQFLVSDDGGRSWEKRPPPGALASLAISPDDPDYVVVAVEGARRAGLYASRGAGSRWQRLTEDGGLLAWTRSGSLFLIDARGSVRESRDDGRTWREVGEIGGPAAAFEAVGDNLYAALHDGTIKLSGDGGRSWSIRSRPQASVTG